MSIEIHTQRQGTAETFSIKSLAATTARTFAWQVQQLPALHRPVRQNVK
jgi:hypothetical protein